MSLVSDERVEELLAIQKCYDALWARLAALEQELRDHAAVAHEQGDFQGGEANTWCADRLAAILKESE